MLSWFYLLKHFFLLNTQWEIVTSGYIKTNENNTRKLYQNITISKHSIISYSMKTKI